MGKYVVLADPHIGRKFKNGVPLSRIGDRERLTMETFRTKLKSVKPDETLIILGDLFDNTNVSPSVIYETYLALCESTAEEVIILAGNHDIRRDGATSSFDILSKMCPKKIKFVKDQPLVLDDAEIIPFSYTKTIEEMIDVTKKTTLFGHFSDKDIPFLTALNRQVFSGHLHNYPNVVSSITFVRSMLPLNHLEDVGRENPMYATCTPDTIPTDTHNKCLRIAGTCDTEGIDALQIAFVKNKDETEDVDSVELGEFDLKTLFFDCMKEHNVSEEVAKGVWECLEL